MIGVNSQIIRKLVFIILFIRVAVGSATPIDSLQNLLQQNPKYGQVRVDILVALVDEYLSLDAERAIIFGQQALTICNDLNLEMSKPIALHKLGEAYLNQNKLDSSIWYLSAAIGGLNKAKQSAELAETHNSRGIAFENKGLYKDAFEDYLTALKIYEAGNNLKGVAKQYLNLGLIHQYKREFKLADTYFKDALRISQNLMYEDGIAAALNNLGINCKEQHQLKEALGYFKRVLSIDTKSGDAGNIAYSLNNIGAVYELMGDYKKANQFYMQSATLKRQVKDYIGLSNSFNNIGSTLINEHKFDLAKAYLDSSYDLSIQYGFRNNTVEIFKSYYELEAAQNNHEKALYYYQKYINAKDSIEAYENEIAISEMQSQYDLSKAEARLIVKEAELKNRNYFIAFSVFLIIMLIGVSIYFYYSNKRIKRLYGLLDVQHKRLLLAKDEAEKAAAVKTQFLSVISHEIRTPLNAIIGVSHLIRDPKHHDQLANNMEIMQTSSENLLQLINDLLDLNKLEVGKVTVESQPFKPLDLLHSLELMFGAIASQKGILFTIKGQENLPPRINGDEVKVNQILTNLISNAIKFTHRGEVELTIEIVKNLDLQGSSILFSITDTGIGIPPEKQSVVFDSFIQAESSTTREYGGTGLGLAITKRLVDLLGGTISLTSKVNIGSTFRVELPFQLADNKPILDSTRSKQSEQFLLGKSILIADDNEVNVLVLKQFLQKWGATVWVAKNGIDALNKLYAKQIDIVLMDIQMPYKDGVEATIEIRHASEPWSTVPIIALTATGDHTALQKYLAIGMNDHMLKPFNPDELAAKLFKYAYNS
jgi:signal transduction histidine kinase/ActR/RegA family two-component response regulator